MHAGSGHTNQVQCCVLVRRTIIPICCSMHVLSIGDRLAGKSLHQVCFYLCHRAAGEQSYERDCGYKAHKL